MARIHFSKMLPASFVQLDLGEVVKRVRFSKEATVHVQPVQVIDLNLHKYRISLVIKIVGVLQLDGDEPGEAC